MDTITTPWHCCLILMLNRIHREQPHHEPSLMSLWESSSSCGSHARSWLELCDQLFMLSNWSTADEADDCDVFVSISYGIFLFDSLCKVTFTSTTQQNWPLDSALQYNIMKQSAAVTKGQLPAAIVHDIKRWTASGILWFSPGPFVSSIICCAVTISDESKSKHNY